MFKIFTTFHVELMVFKRDQLLSEELFLILYWARKINIWTWIIFKSWVIVWNRQRSERDTYQLRVTKLVHICCTSCLFNHYVYLHVCVRACVWVGGLWSVCVELYNFYWAFLALVVLLQLSWNETLSRGRHISACFLYPFFSCFCFIHTRILIEGRVNKL